MTSSERSSYSQAGVPVAYLCIGYAQDFLDEPELQRRGWAIACRLPA